MKKFILGIIALSSFSAMARVIELSPGNHTVIQPSQTRTIVYCLDNRDSGSYACEELANIRREYGMGADNRILQVGVFGSCQIFKNETVFGVSKNGVQVTPTRWNLREAVLDLERLACQDRCNRR